MPFTIPHEYLWDKDTELIQSVISITPIEHEYNGIINLYDK